MIREQGALDDPLDTTNEGTGFLGWCLLLSRTRYGINKQIYLLQKFIRYRHRYRSIFPEIR